MVKDFDSVMLRISKKNTMNLKDMKKILTDERVSDAVINEILDKIKQYRIDPNNGKKRHMTVAEICKSVVEIKEEMRRKRKGKNAGKAFTIEELDEILNPMKMTKIGIPGEQLM
jgi:hypothetical protein